MRSGEDQKAADMTDTRSERSADRGRTPPESPTQLGGRSWWGVLKRTVREFQRDNLTDWAAALTYYAVLSIFPGLLVLVSVLGLLGQSVTGPLIDNIGRIAPGPVREILTGGAHSLQASQGTAGIFAIVG